MRLRKVILALAERITQTEIDDLRLHRKVLHADVVRLERKKLQLQEEYGELVRKIRETVAASEEVVRSL